MSFDTRNNSALTKRAEQVRRWEESDTNREPSVPKNEKGRKIKFPSGCIFLAACISGDKEEVLRLLEAGADINTANVDGLTALHQACIDDNLEMVEFLVERGADINRQDNEGWTPLHATSSCGFVSIARYLLENGADLTAVNSDGELAIDIASTNAMADYLQSLIDEYRIDCDKARQQEEQIMLTDAKKWLRSDASEVDKPHPKTGATALHVAAAKGYTKVLSLLLAGRANVDKQDNDGWTPLHAAAHWGQKEAAEMLIDATADIDVKNYAGQTPIDVADKKITKFLEELKSNNKRAKRRPSSQIRISDNIENHIETPTKLIRVELKPDTFKDTNNEEIPKPPSEPSNMILTDNTDEEAPWRRSSSIRSGNQSEGPLKPEVPEKEIKTPDSEVILRRTQSFENDEKKLISPPVSPSAPVSTSNTGQMRSISEDGQSPNVTPAESSPERKNETKNTETSSFRNKMSPGNLIKNFFKSFVPPVRDEESETQRKAHAKRVRETRRSTQGVTLDEIKSAEELVKKNKLNNNNNTKFKLEDVSSGTNYPVSSSTIMASAPAVIAAANLSAGTQKRNNSVNTTTSSSRPVSSSAVDSTSIPADGSADLNSEVTITLRKSRNNEDKENDKENDVRNVQATQAVIQRRRKPKRRSTGVVHLDMDEIDPDKQDSPGDIEDKESGSERTSRSRLSSTPSTTDTDKNDTKLSKDSENGEVIDYKALWEAVKLENEKLKKEMKKKDDDLSNAKAAVERFTNATTKNSLSELEKRERRAMERKLSEMEEELKHLDILKSENQRLKEENGALIRVISKLSK